MLIGCETRCANGEMDQLDFSILDLPREVSVDDPDAYLRAAIAWHFSAETGSAYWLSKVPDLDFDPLTDVTTFEDLTLFPNLVAELRDVAAEDLIPRGYGSPAPVFKVFESGGTTGAPKRIIATPDWREQSARWAAEDFANGGYVRGRGLLGIVPAGPHFVGTQTPVVAERLGSVYYTVDLDPRWVKKLIARGDLEHTAAYVEHLVEQVGYLLRSQDIGNIFTTPPIIQAIARDDELVKLVNDKVRYLVTGGAQMDADTYLLLRDVFPNTTSTMLYGNTMILGQMMTRMAQPVDGVFVFDPCSPYVTARVVDPDTGKTVRYGERGRVELSYVAKTMFIPKNLERDTAIRYPGLPGKVGDSIAAVRPVLAFEGEQVIEGVY